MGGGNAGNRIACPMGCWEGSQFIAEAEPTQLRPAGRTPPRMPTWSERQPGEGGGELGGGAVQWGGVGWGRGGSWGTLK